MTYGTGETNGLRVIIEPHTYDIVLVRETPLDISFSVSVKMNYRYSKTELTLKDLDKCFDKWNTGAHGTVSVTMFNAILNVKLDKEMVHSYDEASHEKFGFFSEGDDIDICPEMLKITLEDGTIVDAYYVDTTNNAGLKATELSIEYIFYTDMDEDEKFTPIAVNPEKIVSIEAGNTVIYEK